MLAYQLWLFGVKGADSGHALIDFGEVILPFISTVNQLLSKIAQEWCNLQ